MSSAVIGRVTGRTDSSGWSAWWEEWVGAMRSGGAAAWWRRAPNRPVTVPKMVLLRSGAAGRGGPPLGHMDNAALHHERAMVGEDFGVARQF
ncbi:MAG: hypothetical protein ACP5NP_16365, partial [Acetobacteraceae bacterium]